MFEVLGAGTEAVVYRGPLLNQVTKSYKGHNRSDGLSAALIEFNKLQRLQAVNDDKTRVPKPFEVIDNEIVGLVMEYCDGVVLNEYMATEYRSSSSIESIARRVIMFSINYSSFIDEPCRDLESGNVIYCEKSDILSFIDFSSGVCSKTNKNFCSNNYLVSLAEFISSLIFGVCRPKNIGSYYFRRNAVLMIQSIFMNISLKDKNLEVCFYNQVKESLSVRMRSVGGWRGRWIWFISIFIMKKLK